MRSVLLSALVTVPSPEANLGLLPASAGLRSSCVSSRPRTPYNASACGENWDLQGRVLGVWAVRLENFRARGRDNQ